MTETSFKNDIWNDPADAEKWGARIVCADLISRITLSVFDEHVDPSGTIVEIGSGIGALGDFLQGRYPAINSEGSETMIEAHKKKVANEGGSLPTIVKTDLYRLPYAMGSVDTVTGMLVLDAMTNPGEAFSEITRVLKPGGKFVYFHDTSASARAVSLAMLDDRLMPIPMQGSRVAGLNRQETERFIKGFAARLANSGLDSQQVIEDLFEPEYCADNWSTDDPEALELMTRTIEEDAVLSGALIRKTTELFNNLLVRMAEEKGMDIISNKLVHTSDLTEIDRIADLKIEDTKDCNVVVHSAIGGYLSRSPDIPEGKLGIGAEILVFVAQIPA